MRNNKLILFILLHLFLINYSQNNKNTMLDIDYDKKENLLKINFCNPNNIIISKKLWLFNNQYPYEENYFQLEILENSIPLFPKALDVLITPVENIDLEEINPSLNHKINDTYVFAIIEENDLKSQINKLNMNGTIYFYQFKKGVKYIMQVQLKMNSKIYKSDRIEFIW